MIDADLIPQVAARFKALADEGRLALLSTLQRGEKSVGELAEATGRSQPNVSQHLASLTHAGLVEARRDGKPGLLPDRRPDRDADLRRGLQQPRRARAPGEAAVDRSPAGSPGGR